ncbi:MAG: response regulator [Bacteroidota bacterium]
MSKKITVMLIDDSKIDLFIHNEFIRKMNISNSVLQFNFAKEALEFLKTKDSSFWPDLILLDIHMPIMNGFDFLEEYGELPLLCRNKCKIVIVSSSLDFNDKLKANESPFVLQLLEKPLNIGSLMKVLTQNNVI